MAAQSAPPKKTSKKTGQKTAKKSATPAPILVINRQNIIGWLLVGVMGCGLMFLTGVLVGRNTMPLRFDMEALDEKLANLKQSVLTNKIEAIDVIENLKSNRMPQVKPDDPHTLTPKYEKGEVHQAAVKPEASPSAEAAAAEGGTGEAAEAGRADSEGKQEEAEASPLPEPVETKRARRKPAQAAAPESDRETSRETVRKPAAARPVQAGGYTIQIASVKDPENAGKVRDRFLEKGYPAYCQKATVKGSTYHRIRIGPYPSREAAKKDYQSLEEAGVSAMMFLVDKSQ